MTLWSTAIAPISKYFRLQRFQRLLTIDPDFLSKRILDDGGSVHFWQKLGIDLRLHPNIVLLNVSEGDATIETGLSLAIEQLVIYDGQNIPFDDGHFDCVFSNSVIEHVPLEQRPRFVSELRRVGQSFIVQTPARCFPIEPHFVAPFLHWIPRGVARRLARHTPWAWLGRKTRDEANRYFDEVHLLDMAELRVLFPDATIVIERFLGWPKSYLAVKCDGLPIRVEAELPAVEQVSGLISASSLVMKG